jgi:hypothetical protein
VSSLREQLLEREWRQGAIIKSGAIEHPGMDGHDAYLILNQTCDLLAEKITTEPYAELLPLTCISKIDPNFEGGKNSRKIHFQVELDGEAVFVEGAITARVMLPRELLLQTGPSTRWKVGSRTINGLLVWFTRRFLRTAFPDSFERRLKPLLKKSKTLNKGIVDVLQPHHSLIDTLFLRINTMEELPAKEAYEVKLLLAAKKADLDDPAKLELLHSMANQLGSIFGNADGVELDGLVMVESLHKISLAQQRDYLIWERYDYLSFGEDD